MRASCSELWRSAPAIAGASSPAKRPKVWRRWARCAPRDWLRSNGAELESEPQEYTYEPGYYAVFFYDPDGMKLEIVHVPALAA